MNEINEFSDKITKSFLLVVTIQVYAIVMAIASFLFMVMLGVPLVLAFNLPLVLLAIIGLVTTLIIASMPKTIELNMDMIDQKPKAIRKAANLYIA